MFCARCKISDAAEVCPRCGGTQISTWTPAKPTPIARRLGRMPAKARARRKQTSAAYASPELRGVGGWLFFFLLQLTLSPLAVILRFFLSSHLGWLQLVNVAVASFGLFTALFLLREHPIGLDLLRKYFTIVALLSILGFVRFALLPGGAAQSSRRVFALSLSLLWTAIWFVYFHDSARVQATYGRNL